ncbi:tRNA uridine-5-carboxymethylaminomethyl(34) synthesis GTPase MnmE [Candidatus Synechococcus calcipolaris G9]|uniref:tRNA modification GTPase MnmE n=1 Tax=Candidatus Synechococcus calcipolaris G9 TaxID=1497997 RepID=A0ABT6EZ74_9SYNE|nr:tRNA uridine-5-carboxymethylaminomethyl(34) synthesis GTPase MnmE [Candidatus Synechococcus calcipolaris]MDG2990891.1 tRNA uridine-5-carboxymethylaminomethyl(34) synthesis GTPase MnmE [Candidatus Synechococcus calcipolaris G9]
MNRSSTIAAIATAIVPQQGSIGIVRLSGPESVAIAQSLFHAPGHQAWQSHRILYGHIRDPQGEQIIDEALLLLMLAPRSYTREDVVEFHCHGGMMPVQQVLQLCLSQGAQLAQPGEFTLRAFLNGRLDLTQAESVADLVGAKSPQAAQYALAGLQGKLTQPLGQIRAACLELLTEIEARLDFADDLPPLNGEQVRQDILGLHHQVQHILATADRGELIRTGLKVAIVGQPNVGKSSLLNAWSRCDRAIVTDLPGTTRDVVESQLVVGGIPIQVLDTAGIRATEDRVEQLGVERSTQAAAQADLVLFVVDAQQGWTDGEQAIYDRLCSGHRPRGKKILIVINKIDLVDPNVQPQALLESLAELSLRSLPIVCLSALQHQGILELEQGILHLMTQGDLQATNLDLAINQRQASILAQVSQFLEHTIEAIAADLPLDFWTIDLRAAARALGELTGEDVNESVLDQIFSRFCIGK